MTDYVIQREWADKRIGDQVAILQHHFGDYDIDIAEHDEDTKHNTDLVIRMEWPLRIACRIRKHYWYLNHSHDITMRSRWPDRPSELRKVIKGYGHYMLYCFATPNNDGILAWRLIDLSEFRWWYSCMRKRKERPFKVYPNKDGSPAVLVFDTHEMFPECIVAEHMPEIEPASNQ